MRGEVSRGVDAPWMAGVAMTVRTPQRAAAHLWDAPRPNPGIFVVSALFSVERQFERSGARMTTTSTIATRKPVTAAPTRAARTSTARSGSVAAQVKEQRRNYARAVVRSLARVLQGQPVAQVQRQLRSALTPLGVRLSPVVLRELAVGIAAGTAVELP